MILDAATELTEGQQLAFDLCIVGAGPAGQALALALEGSGLNIGILSSGTFEENERHQELYRGTMSGIDTWDLDRTRLRLFGGSSAHWAGWCRPLDGSDFEERSWVPHSGWPITLSELEPYYDLAHEFLEIGPATFDAELFAEATGHPLILQDSDRVETVVFQYSPPTRLTSRYLTRFEDATDLSVYTDANLLEIMLDDEHEMIDHLRCSTIDGLSFTVTADRYVLAMGGIENARMLLASNQQLDSGVANVSGAVGRYFMEHPHYFRVVPLVAAGDPDLSFYGRHNVPSGADGNLAGTRIQGMLRLKSEVRAAEGLPDWLCQFNASEPADYEDAKLGLETLAAMVQPESPSQTYSLFTLRCEQFPNPNSRITLDTEVDELGIPRVILDWQVPEDEDRKMARSLQILGAELAAAGFGRCFVPMEDGLLSWHRQKGNHHMGTTRMGNDPSMSVVDANSRSHDVSNLYIAGSSVFTTGGSANPTLTIVALAHRLADHLRP